MHKRIYLKAMGLTGLVLLIIAVLMTLFPFGHHLLFPGDLASQYTPFLNLLKQSLSHPSDIIYSFQNGLGSSNLSLISYYLTSPFNLILLLIPSRFLFEGVLGLIALKIVLASGSMSYYLATQRHSTTWVNPLLSMSYALCGFVSIYFYNILWMDVMVFLPLIIAGLERYITNKKVALYQWSLLLLLLSNYYMGWMVCLFLGLYFFYFTGKTEQLSPWGVLCKKGRLLLSFIGRSLVIVMILGFIYLPTIQSMLSTDKGHFSLSSLWEPLWQCNILGLSGFGMGMGQYPNRLEHYPIFYAGLLVLILAVTYLVTKHKGIWYDRLFFIIVMLCTVFTPFVMIFQLFQPTAGFPFRNTYFVVFMMIVFAEPISQHVAQYKRQLVITGISLALFFLSLIALRHILTVEYPLDEKTLMVNAIVTLLWTVILTCFSRRFVITLLLSIELLTNMLIAMTSIPTVLRHDLHRYQDEMQQALPSPSSYIERTDNTAIDESKDHLTLTGYNNGIWFGYNGVSSYTSTLENDNLTIAQTLGLYSWNERRISNFGATPLSQYLLAVRHVLTEEHHHIKSVTTSNHNAIFVLRNQPTLTAHHAFDNQNQLSQALGNKTVFDKASFKVTKQTDTLIQIKVKAPQTGMLYLQLPNQKLNYNDNYRITCQNKAVTLPLSLRNQTLVPLHHVEKGKTQTISIQTAQPQQWDGIQVAVFNNKAFCDMKKQTEAAPVKQDGLTLTTTLNSQHDTALMSVPYDKNWRATINGRTVTPERSELGFIQLPIKRGQNHIQLHYVPTALIVGVLLSCIGLMIEIFLIWKKRR